MSTLRISDAPLLPDVNGAEKIPTGGRGDYTVSINQIKAFTQGGVPQQIENHINDTSNPHQVTKDQVGLANVDNTSDIDKPVSNSTQAAISQKADKSVVYTKQESSDLVDNSISTALTPVNASLNLVKRGIANRYDPLLTYNSGETVILTNGDIVKSTIDGNTTNPNTDRTGWSVFGNSNILAIANPEYPEYSPFSYMTINSIPLTRKANLRNYYAEKPSEFDWDVHGVRAWFDRNGIMQHSLDISKYDVASKAVGVVEYFVRSGGTVTSDNLGTDPTKPLGAIYSAISRINTNAVSDAIIWITPEVYTDGPVWGASSAIKSNVSIKIWNGSVTAPFADTTNARATITTETTGLTWTAVGSNTFSTSRRAVGAVVDETLINKLGDWTLYEKVADLAACQAKAGTWAQDGTTLYVHTHNNRTPDALCHIYVTKMNAEADTGNYTLYCERVNFYGGERAFYGHSSTLAGTEYLVFNKCSFKYATANNLGTIGSKYTILLDCDSNYGGNDGFNYHTSLEQNTKISYHLEVNCVAYQNGKSWSSLIGSNNGSTVHDGCYIARFNTITFENEGPNIADVGGGKSWLFNCQSRDSKNLYVLGTHADFYTQNNLMWLDHCDASGSRYSVAANNLGRIYIRNCNLYARVFQANKLINWPTSTYTIV